MADGKLPTGASQLRKIAADNATGPGVPWDYASGTPKGTPGAQGTYEDQDYKIDMTAPSTQANPLKPKGA